MYIYNVTVNVEDDIKDRWLNWIKNHIPQVLATGKFTGAKLSKVLVDEKNNTTTYSIQYRAKSRKDLDDYYTYFAENLRNDGLRLFADKMLAFRTELEIIDEFDVTFHTKKDEEE